MSGREERTVLFQLPTVIVGQLVCVQGSVVGRSWDLSAGTFVIGRSSTSDLPLPNEPGVSKSHAKIIAEGERYVLVDSESRNGTIVNGKPVQRKVLADGDEVRICNCVLRFSQRRGTGIDLDDVAAASDEAGAFEQGSGTSPEQHGLTQPGGPPSALPVSLGDAPALPADPTAQVQALSPRADGPPPLDLAPDDLPPDDLPDQQPPDDALARPAEPTDSTLLDPIIIEQSQSALPWFFAGLGLMLVVGAGGWSAFRVMADDLPAPTEALAAAEPPAEEPGDDLADEPAAPIAEDDGEEPAALASAEPSAEEAEPVVAPEPAGPAEPAEPEEPAAQEKPKPKPPVVAKRTPPPVEEPAAREPSPWYAVELQRAQPTPVRARATGRVASVEVQDGASVRKGQAILSFADAGGEDVTNLKANIEALEAVAESQPSAQDMLEQERAKLARLLARSRNARVTAPASGTLRGFTVKAGDRLAAGAVVGSVDGGGVDRLVADVSADDGRDLKAGSAIEVKRKDGSTGSGRVASARNKGDRVEVVLTVDEPGDVAEVRFP